MEQGGVKGMCIECSGERVEDRLLIGGWDEGGGRRNFDMGEWVANHFFVERFDQIAFFEPFEHLGREAGCDQVAARGARVIEQMTHTGCLAGCALLDFGD